MHHSKVERIAIPAYRRLIGIFFFIAIFALFIAPKAALSDNTLEPSKAYTPQQVISIVVDSLQNNSDDDSGIATVFRFASPGNKSATGPLTRFTRMIKIGFPDMLNHVGVRYDSIKITGDSAVQAVWLQSDSGAEFGYAFEVGKQRGGDYDGMWMTEAVVPLGKNKNSGIRI